MISRRIQVRLKSGNTSTTIKRQDGELDVATALSKELTAELNKRCGPDVQAIYIEVITR